MEIPFVTKLVLTDGFKGASNVPADEAIAAFY